MYGFSAVFPHTEFFREEIARQKNILRQRKLQEEGKTDQARSDLARLALIRKQREEAARKRDEQKKGMRYCCLCFPQTCYYISFIRCGLVCLSLACTVTGFDHLWILIHILVKG